MTNAKDRSLRERILLMGFMMVLAAGSGLVPGDAAARVHGEILESRGAKVFQMCRDCHSLKPGVTLFGPSLAGLLNRPVGSVKGFKYSDALAAAKITWTEQALDRFLAQPQAFIPWNRMPFPGLENSMDRKAVINYLKIATSVTGRKP